MSLNAKKILGEFLGCVFVSFFGLGYIPAMYMGYCASTHVLACWFGLVYSFGVLIFSPISGLHATTGVTLSFSMYHGFDKKLIPAYLLVQVLGWGVGILLSYAMFNTALIEQCESLGVNPATIFYCHPHNVPTACTVEFFTAMLLMIGIYAVTDARLPSFPGVNMIPISVGVVIAVCVSLGVGISGGALNFARDFGARLACLVFGLVMGYPTDTIFAGGSWLIYLVCPTLGAVCGGVLYQKVFIPLLPTAKK